MAQGAWEPEPTAPEATVRSRSPPKREGPTSCVAQGTLLIFLGKVWREPITVHPKVLSHGSEGCGAPDQHKHHHHINRPPTPDPETAANLQQSPRPPHPSCLCPSLSPPSELVQGVAMSPAAVTPLRSFVQTPIHGRTLKSTLHPAIFWEMVKFVDLGVLYLSLVLPV